MEHNPEFDFTGTMPWTFHGPYDIQAPSVCLCDKCVKYRRTQLRQSSAQYSRMIGESIGIALHDQVTNKPKTKLVLIEEIIHSTNVPIELYVGDDSTTMTWVARFT